MKKLIFIMVLMSLLMALGVYATDTVTLNAPASSGTLYGADNELNVTFDFDNPALTINCSISASSPSTANSSSSAIFINVTNSSGRHDVNATLPILAIFEDSNDYTVTAQCYNGSDWISATSSTGVTFDRTVPQSATTSHSDDAEFADADTITYTVTGENTTGCRIAFLQSGASIRFTGSNTYAMTYSGDSCTYTVEQLAPSDGVYEVYVQASDGTNTSLSSKINFYINTFADDLSGSDYTVEVAKAVISKKQTQNFLIVLILIVVSFVFLKKKK